MNVRWMVKAWRNQIAIIVLICSTSLAVEFAGGTGEPNDPYQIATAEQLIGLGEDPNIYDKHFILTADIDLNYLLPGRKVFDKAVIAPDFDDTSSRFDGTPFTGVFDGNDHTISHLMIMGYNYLGLFGQTDGATISGLGLEAVHVSGIGDYVGGLVGQNGGDASHCYSTGTVGRRPLGSIYESESVGGLVGGNGGTITICYSTAAVSGYRGVGGLVGTNSGDIVLSYSTGTVAGRALRGTWESESVGGLVGGNRGTITICYSTGMVSGNYTVGGLVGKSSSLASITTCYSSASVSGDETLGRFVGYNLGGLVGLNEGNISMSYSCGTVNGVYWIGGLVGDNRGSITMSYSTGRVSGDESVGGLVGDSFSGDAVVTASYWDIETSNEPNMCGVDRWGNCDNSYGKTTAEMQDINTYLSAGWDFVDEVENGTEDIWKMPPYKGYPLLAWQEVPTIAELIAHWRFDETSGDIAYDSAGNNDAALHQIEFAEGKIGGAVLLNGFNSYIDCGDSVALGPEQMTLTMWLEPRHMGGVRYAVSRAKKEDLDDIDYTITRHLAGEIELTLAQLDSVPVSVLSTATTPLGEWSHLAVCLDGSEASIYINGQLDSFTNYSQRVPRQGYRLVISSHQGITRFYNGKIDDVRIYNGPLNEQDILSLANPDI